MATTNLIREWTTTGAFDGERADDEVTTGDREALWTDLVDNARVHVRENHPDLSDDDVGELALCYANAFVGAL